MANHHHHHHHQTTDGRQQNEPESPMSLLPEACIAAIISCTTPRDACRLSLVSSIFKSAAESDVVWDRFLPPGYQSIISNSSPRPSSSSSPRPSSSSSPPSLQCLRPKKKLFLSLCDHPILIDDGKKAFYLDKRSGKKCYMIFARELMIVWGHTPEDWAWSSLPGARFHKVAVLIDVCWLEIHGKISTCILTPGTHYTAFLVFNLMADSYGFHYRPLEVSVGLVGSESQKRDVYLDVVTGRRDSHHPREREDNWLEVELGDFYNAGDGDDELEMSILEVKGGVRKGGPIVRGIEIRPKQGKHTSDLPCEVFPFTL